MDATRIRRFRCSLTICLRCRQPPAGGYTEPVHGADAILDRQLPPEHLIGKAAFKGGREQQLAAQGGDGPHEQHHAVQRSVRDHGPDTVEKVIHGQEVGQRALLVERPPAVRLHPTLELQPFPVGLHVGQGPHLRGQHLDAHDLGLGDAVLLQLPVGVITARRDIDLVSLEQEHHLHLAGRGIAQHLDLVVGGDHLPGHRVVRGDAVRRGHAVGLELLHVLHGAFPVLACEPRLQDPRHRELQVRAGTACIKHRQIQCTHVRLSCNDHFMKIRSAAPNRGAPFPSFPRNRACQNPSPSGRGWPKAGATRPKPNPSPSGRGWPKAG